MMIEAIIRWAVGNRMFVLLATIMIVGGGLYSLKIPRWMPFLTCRMCR